MIIFCSLLKSLACTDFSIASWELDPSVDAACGSMVGAGFSVVHGHGCSQVGFGIGSNTSNEVSLQENEHSQ